MLTVSELQLALPKNLKGVATQELANKINAASEDPEMAREIRENFVTFNQVLMEGKYKIEDYLNAISYCTYKIMGFSNKEAYCKAFPERYQRLVANEATEKDISAYVAMYHKNKLVNAILAQAFIPMWLVNQETFQKAINTQAELMMTANSELVRTQAANSILQHLKQPETKKVELDVKLKGGGGLDELRSTMAELAQRQSDMIAAGAGAKAISRVPIMIVDEDVTDVVVPQPMPAPAPRPPAIASPAQPTTVAGLRSAMKGTIPAGEEDLPPTRHILVEKLDGIPEPETEEPVVLSLFGNSKPKPKTETVFEIKTPAVNYAKCCDSMIEDCSCVETDHIYLPVKADVPALKRVSLFDDPADMP